MNRSPQQVYIELQVLRAQDGFLDALAELVDEFQLRLVRHARYLTGNREGAEEAVQEAWLAMVKQIKTLDDPARFPQWAYRIVTFKSVDWVRKAKKDRKSTREVMEMTLCSEGESSPEKEEVQSLRRALQKLNSERRALLALHYLEGQSVSELAEIFAIPKGTVKSRLYHARQELKQILTDMES